MKIMELANHLECNDASMEAQNEAAAYLRRLSRALRELTQVFTETVNGEWGRGVGERWLPDDVKEVLKQIGKDDQ